MNRFIEQQSSFYKQIVAIENKGYSKLRAFPVAILITGILVSWALLVVV